jgi:hypothetical protein
LDIKTAFFLYEPLVDEAFKLRKMSLILKLASHDFGGLKDLHHDRGLPL